MLNATDMPAWARFFRPIRPGENLRGPDVPVNK